jgi:hypothetical protein
MHISQLAYDAESDELDLLINAQSPMPAKSVLVGEGIYIRRDACSGRVVGAFIRGCLRLVEKLHSGRQVSDENAKQLGVHEALQAILQWVRDRD